MIEQGFSLGISGRFKPESSERTFSRKVILLKVHQNQRGL
jgi:hypothetical protein